MRGLNQKFMNDLSMGYWLLSESGCWPTGSSVSKSAKTTSTFTTGAATAPARPGEPRSGQECAPEFHWYSAAGCFMDYGLFDQAVLPLEEARSRFEAYI